jgi:hypothetical protein
MTAHALVLEQRLLRLGGLGIVSSVPGIPLENAALQRLYLRRSRFLGVHRREASSRRHYGGSPQAAGRPGGAWASLAGRERAA